MKAEKNSARLLEMKISMATNHKTHEKRGFWQSMENLGAPTRHSATEQVKSTEGKRRHNAKMDSLAENESEKLENLHHFDGTCVVRASRVSRVNKLSTRFRHRI